eukprot:m.1273212 g.1273212  ORF g.1273212 m.1273212 type:complete len:1882 (-) comp24753_c0_seq1:749-6394(-)
MSRREAMLAKKYGASWKEENPTMVHRKEIPRSAPGGSATSATTKSSDPAKSAVTPKQYIMHKLIRAPRTSNKTFNLMKFREGSEVNVTSLVEPVTLTRDEAEGDEQLLVSYPTQGEGSEYGRAERDAIRRLKYRPRKEKEKDVHYHLKDKDGAYLLGELQREARGKYFLLEALEGGMYQIRPVDNFWEFRKHRVIKTHTTVEDAELAIKQRAKTVDVSRFFEKSLRGNTDSKRLRAETEQKMRIDRGENDKPSDTFDDGTGTATGKKKKKVTKIATQKKITEDRNVDEEEVENVDDDFYAPDSDTELGGTKGSDWYANAENRDAGSSSEEEEENEAQHVDALAGEGVVRRQRDSDDDDDDDDGPRKASVTDSYSTIDEKDVFFAPHGLEDEVHVDTIMKRSAAYWQAATRTSAVRGSAHSGLPANDFNDMFTIIHQMVLQQAEVEALNHMRNAALSGHTLQHMYRTCVGAVQRLVCIHESPTDRAQETVLATKDSGSVVNIEAHLTQYLEATGVVSPLMLWGLAAEIPPGDPLFLEKAKLGGHLLIEKEMQDDGPVELKICNVEFEKWLKLRGSPAIDNMLSVSEDRVAGADGFASQELQYKYGLKVPPNLKFQANNERKDYGTAEKRIRKMRKARKASVNAFAPRWYSINSVTTSPPLQEHRLAPFEDWAPWEVTARLDKYIRFKALTLMRESYEKCSELYDLYMALNRDGMFACSQCLTRSCVAERNLWDLQLTAKGPFAELFTAVPQVHGKEGVFIYERTDKWISSARFKTGPGLSGAYGGKIHGWVTWQARGQERGFKDPMLGGTVWARTYGQHEKKHIWVRHPKSIHCTGTEDFRLLIPWDCKDKHLRDAVQNCARYQMSGHIAVPSGVIFRAKWIRAQREPEIIEAFKSGRSPPMQSSKHWDALKGPNQKEYRRDMRRDDRVVLEFEELYYVVRKVHRASFEPLKEPLPVCTACFLEQGTYVPAKYFSKQVVSRVNSLGVLNPSFNVFYTDPVWAYHHMVMPAVMQHPHLRRYERRVKDSQALTLAKWGAFGCGELSNPLLDTRGSKGARSKRSGERNTAAAQRRVKHQLPLGVNACGCEGKMHQCAKYLVAVSLVRYVTTCTQLRFQVGTRVVEPVRLVKESDDKYYWSVSSGTNRASVNSTLHLYEMMTACKTATAMVCLSADNNISHDAQALFQVLMAVDRTTFGQRKKEDNKEKDSKKDSKKSKESKKDDDAKKDGKGAATGDDGDDADTADVARKCTLVAVDLLPPGTDTSEDGFVPMREQLAGAFGDEVRKAVLRQCRYTYNIDVGKSEHMATEYKKLCIPPNPRMRITNDTSYMSYARWSKNRRTYTLTRPDMLVPVRLAVDEPIDLPAFSDAPLSTGVYRTSWSAIHTTSDGAHRVYTLTFTCDQISGRMLDCGSRNPWTKEDQEHFHVTHCEETSLGGVYTIQENEDFVVDGKVVQNGDCIRSKQSTDQARHMLATQLYTAEGEANTKWELRDTALVSWTDIAAHISGRSVVGAVLATGDQRGWQTPWEFVEAGQGDAANKLVVVVRCVNSALNLARSQRERTELEELATDLRNKFMEEKVEIPYGRDVTPGAMWNSWQCEDLDKFDAAKTFELPRGEHSLRVCGTVLNVGDLILTGIGNHGTSGTDAPSVYRFVRATPDIIPTDPYSVVMELVCTVEPYDDEGGGALFRHMYVLGGNNAFKGNYAKVIRKGGYIQVLVAPPDTVDAQWKQWQKAIRSTCTVELTKADVRNCLVRFEDIARGTTNSSSHLIRLRLHTVSVDSDAYHAVKEGLETGMKPPFDGLRVLPHVDDVLEPDVFASSKIALDEAVWKPLLEVACLTREVGAAGEAGSGDGKYAQNTTVTSVLHESDLVLRIRTTEQSGGSTV